MQVPETPPVSSVISSMRGRLEPTCIMEKILLCFRWVKGINHRMSKRNSSMNVLRSPGNVWGVCALWDVWMLPLWHAWSWKRMSNTTITNHKSVPFNLVCTGSGFVWGLSEKVLKVQHQVKVIWMVSLLPSLSVQHNMSECFSVLWHQTSSLLSYSKISSKKIWKIWKIWRGQIITETIHILISLSLCLIKTMGLFKKSRKW